MSHPAHADHHSAHGSHGHAEHHVIGYGLYIQIWLILCVFTSLTVVASTMDFGHTMNVVVALVIASIKASLVVLYFMHVKYDWALLKFLVYVTIGTIALILPVYFSDFLTR